MRVLIVFLALLLSLPSFAQNEALGKNYYEKGEYEKALTIFKRLAAKNPHRTEYTVYTIKSYQQLEEFEEAEKLIQKKLETPRPLATFFVELGYNFALQEKDSLAHISYERAIREVQERPFNAYAVGRAFSDYSLLDYAVITYETAMELEPDRNYNPQLARIYGEQGKLDKMFEKYIDLILQNPSYRASAQRNFSYYINEDPNNEANAMLRKTLLKKIQQRPELLFNELLSWLFIQQKEFKKAFIQEKAIYKRSDEDLRGIVDLLRIAIEEEHYEDAREIAQFVIDKAPTSQIKLEGYQYLMNVGMKIASPNDYPTIEKQYLDLFDEFGKGPETLALQIDYYHFLAFMNGRSTEAIMELKKLAKEGINIYQEARVKMKLADILVFDEKFNEALIFYTQVQKKVKNDLLAQEARFKVARTSYFKGDFDWAQIQLDVLKKSASQLIANDAMQLALMISDNSLEDSTRTALKKFSRADLLTLQKKETDALTLLQDILTNHKGEKIEDEALLKSGQVYESLGQFEQAAAQYSKLIELYNEDILADDAHYRLAKLYEGPLAQTEKAKELYEQIIFNFADSIYFVDARRRYRMLRGDSIN
ncbi:MAG: tetratricopeptide repeat protein [Flavobacteriaceae bacterium]|nr:tetratricopeptide repeat protein [Flavobacteriaceae bacterium]